MFTKTLSPSALQYKEALDYISAMKAEDKYNAASLSIFGELYNEQVTTLTQQGFFNPINN